MIFTLSSITSWQPDEIFFYKIWFKSSIFSWGLCFRDVSVVKMNPSAALYLLIIYPNPAQGLYRDDAAGKIAGTFVASRDYESNFLLHLSILCNVFFLLL